MQVSLSNDVKVYNLSAGKSLPEWITDRKRRKLEQKDVDIRRRIQLIQDFDMNNVSHAICVSRDGRYILTAGSYKPTVKCYEVNELSLKFERGLDADVIKIAMLSDDYSKFALLEEERYVELHTNYGKYFRLRIPKFGRDMSFCREASELYIVGSSNEIFRLNLEEGKFLEPLIADAPSLTACQFNEQHQLFVAGTTHGRVEAWDYRDRSRAATLDVASHVMSDDNPLQSLPEVSCLKFKDALHLAVGTSTGHTILYDIRSSKPLLVKDQRMGLAIKQIEFVKESNLVLSMDSRALKMWHEEDGSPFAALEPGTRLNDFARYPNSGLLFFANDAEKMLQYFVPALGPAPKWCSYLDNITEELEESEQPAVYDDYKFVTKAELEEIGLTNLLGTSMLRAYMHGYFIDMRLYNRARTLTQPQAYESYKRRKLREKIDEERESTSIKKEKKLPKVNRELASKLLQGLSIGETAKAKKEVKQAAGLLHDDRFKQLFRNPDFEVDEHSDQYKQIAPMLKKLEGKKSKRTEDESEETIKRERIPAARKMTRLATQRALRTKKTNLMTQIGPPCRRIAAPLARVVCD
ncbi:hypothetical protein AAVH_02719 [Aphelenchoides avenae]|nr:hypothetical protein AAVH_02719 [Aphelenchus avenae]